MDVQRAIDTAREFYAEAIADGRIHERICERGHAEYSIWPWTPGRSRCLACQMQDREARPAVRLVAAAFRQ